MKYIRIEDGIITDKLYEQALEVCALTYKNAQNSDLKILKQANNIEELVDEFVIIPIDQDKKPITHFIRHVNEPINAFALDSHIIYGAIWTDKGLIYVAKMNEKGELELL